MNPRYLETKFHIPSWRTAGVSRPRLVKHLLSGLEQNHKLALICAPAGYGKTTLVTDWLNAVHAHTHFTWLSLEENDNDPVRFLGYTITAFQRVQPELGQSALSLLSMPTPPPLTHILDELLNDLAYYGEKIILVLDDYHSIHHSQIHEALEYFLEHLPPQTHLAITSREDPPLPLARLRARGQMTEIRAHDLRFTPDEALTFFNHCMHLNLDSTAVRSLESRTEGWAAGMQLAALAMQNLPDHESFLREFNGSHRYIIDYLLDEVLKRQPAAVRNFLSQTSILKRFNASLCKALTEDAHAAETLAQLEQANLFLIPLDDQRGWYRYHHLFADVLRAGLDEKSEQSANHRAAAWFEEQNLLPEALSYRLSGKDTVQAARLLRMLAVDLLKNGELQSLLAWLQALPEAVIQADIELVSYKALAMLLTGSILEAQEYAVRAYQQHTQQFPHSSTGRLLAIQAWIAMSMGNAQTQALAEAALEQLGAADAFFRVLSLVSLGSSLGWTGKIPASIQVFREAYQLGKTIQQPSISLAALTNLAFNLLEMGNLYEAEELCLDAVQFYVDSRGLPLPILGIIYAPLAYINFDKGDFDTAVSYAEKSLEQCKRLFSNSVLGGDSEIILALVAFRRGDPEKSQEILQSTAQFARQYNMLMVIIKMVIIQVEIQLMQGNLSSAKVRLQELDQLVENNLSKMDHIVEHLHARYLAMSGQAQPAIEILQRLEQADREEGCIRRLIGVLITQAMLQQASKKPALAEKIFGEALQLAAARGFRSMFFPNEERKTVALLNACRPLATEFVDSILQKHPQSEAPALARSLPDALTEQELKILSLINAGKSNQEIAAEMVITPGTAKWHVHNILQKLGVKNRSQAIVRARELDIE